MWSTGLYLATLLAICFIWLISNRRNSRSNELVLPPGSKGFPLLGETLQLLIPCYSLDLPYFLRSRIQRYGPIFKTRILGKPVVVSADMDFNRYLVQQEGRLVELWYAASEVFGLEEHRTNAAGLIHKYQRNNTMKLFGFERLREDLLPLLDDLVQKSLHSWSTQESINVKEAALTMVVEFAAKQVFGYDVEKSKIKLGEKFANIAQGLFSLPLKIPGTTYHKCLK